MLKFQKSSKEIPMERDNKLDLLLKKIMELEITSDKDVFPFNSRLARENNWSITYATLAIKEYKRFIFLMITSDEVDQVWHLHMLYTKSYWNDLCSNILKKQIHHNPTKGGKSESDRFMNQYIKTLSKYQEVFEETPPKEIWPKPTERFKNVTRYVRIDTSKIFLSKNTILLVGSNFFMNMLLALNENLGLLIFFNFVTYFFLYAHTLSFTIKDKKESNKSN